MYKQRAMILRKMSGQFMSSKGFKMIFRAFK